VPTNTPALEEDDTKKRAVEFAMHVREKAQKFDRLKREIIAEYKNSSEFAKLLAEARLDELKAKLTGSPNYTDKEWQLVVDAQMLTEYDLERIDELEALAQDKEGKES
jgi:hypothetical protein